VAQLAFREERCEWLMVGECSADKVIG
jgi:hypothetical protein